MKPRVFIGSSTEGEAVAREVQKNVAQVCTPVLWKFGDTFRPGRSFLESLEDELKKSEYGIYWKTNRRRAANDRVVLAYVSCLPWMEVGGNPRYRARGGYQW